MDIESMDAEELEGHRISTSPWELAGEDSYYTSTTEGVYNDGYVRQPCLVIQEWEAPEIDESSTTAGEPSATTGGSTGFGWFFVESGVRYIDEVTDSENPTSYDFDNSFWDVQYRAPEAAPELDVQVQGQHEATSTITVDQDDGTTINGTIQQSMYVGYEIINDIDSDNIMGFYLTLDVPSDLVPEGTVIVQQVTYRKEYNYGDWHTVACKTVVGDVTQSEVLNYKGETAPDGYDENGSKVTYDMASYDDAVYSSEDGSEYFMPREDENAYSTEEYGEYSGNKLQNCLAQLPFPKVGVDEEFFGTYDVEFTARIYASADDTDFVQIEITTTTQDFQPPVYSDADLVEEIEDENSVHEIQFIHEQFYF